MKILILGGYGQFGGRLAELLSELNAEIFLVGRNLDKAKDRSKVLSGVATFIPIAADRDNVAPVLAKFQPDILVDASGPFQGYGQNPYKVARACLDAGVHYLDLADSRDFVTGITQFDTEAREKNLIIRSGVSTCPVITGTVLTEIMRDFTPTSLRAGIAPSPFAGLGKSVVRAILSYAGSELPARRETAKGPLSGFVDSITYRIAPPASNPLDRRRYSLVDVPELDVLPDKFPELKNVWFGAGPVPGILLRALNVFGALRRLLRLPPLTWLTPLAYWAMTTFQWGRHRGGMFVETANAQGEHVSWHLIAEGDHGPYIPVIPASIILKRWLEGSAPSAGADDAIDDVNYSELSRAFDNLDIRYGFRRPRDHSGHYFGRFLGETFKTLPTQVQALHDVREKQIWSGEAMVRKGKNPLARIVQMLMGFRAPEGQVPVSVTFTPTEDGEIWTRTFGPQVTQSQFSKGAGRFEHLPFERFGPFRVGMSLIAKDDRLYFKPESWSFLGIPMPRMLCPSGETYETEMDGRFHFNVIIRVPMAGLIAHYEGWLVPS